MQKMAVALWAAQPVPLQREQLERLQQPVQQQRQLHEQPQNLHLDWLACTVPQQCRGYRPREQLCRLPSPSIELLEHGQPHVLHRRQAAAALLDAEVVIVAAELAHAE